MRIVALTELWYAYCLQRAIDEKFSSLEEKEKELRQLHLAMRERDHDLERLRGILSSNEATMQVRADSVLTWHPSPTRILSRKHHLLDKGSF